MIHKTPITHDERRGTAGMQRTSLATAVLLALGGGACAVDAALPDNTVLAFDPGMKVQTCLYGGTVPNCNYMSTTTTVSGSWFSMDTNDDGMVAISEITVISRFNGLTIGATQPASGSHSGPPDGSESPDIDNPWGFFGNTGMDFTTSPVTVSADNGTTQELDFSGWSVTWNAIPLIPMGGDTANFPSDTGIANLSCASDCSNGDGFTLNYASHVPLGDPSNFGGVPYKLYLEGTLQLPGNPPDTQPDMANSIVGNPITVNVLANDSSADGLDPSSVTIVRQATNGTAVANPDGTTTYTPDTGPDFTGMDDFDYTVDSNLGITSVPTLVDIDVEVNVAPVANNDNLSINTTALDNNGGSTVINVLNNDTDANNGPGLPGGIDPATVTVLTPPAVGSCIDNPDGTITYSQPVPSVPVTTTCTYEVSDIDGFNAPLTSNVATVAIEVAAIASDWPPNLDPAIIPTLYFEPGIPGDPNDTAVPAQGGSYFTMQVSSNTLIYTVMIPGPAGGIVVGHEQPAGNSHTGAPTGNEQTAIELGWSFFANTGFSFTRNGGIIGNPDGTLEFAGPGGIGNSQGRFIITWNGIPAIDLGGSPSFPEDLGFATITCDPAPCADQSSFELNYAAHVPPGDPSGFGGVPYTLFMEGTVGFLDGNLKVSNGDVVTQMRMTAEETGVKDTEVVQQCVGDCLDYTIDNITDASVQVVIPLAGGVPVAPVYRILENGVWRSFDTSSGDTIKSAPFQPGDVECPDPGDAAYTTDADGKPVTGHQCLEVTIADNGPNDKNPAVGTISDPSGLGGGGNAGGGQEEVGRRNSSTSGCTIGDGDIAFSTRSEWWLLGGFLAWLGWRWRTRQSRGG